MLRGKNRIAKTFFKNFPRESRNFSTPLFTLRVAKSASPEEGRVAVIVSKKVAHSAVERNRIRRRVYGFIETAWLKKTAGFLFFYYPKKEILKSKPRDIANSLREVFEAVSPK